MSYEQQRKVIHLEKAFDNELLSKGNSTDPNRLWISRAITNEQIQRKVEQGARMKGKMGATWSFNRIR